MDKANQTTGERNLAGDLSGGIDAYSASSSTPLLNSDEIDQTATRMEELWDKLISSWPAVKNNPELASKLETLWMQLKSVENVTGILTANKTDNTAEIDSLLAEVLGDSYQIGAAPESLTSVDEIVSKEESAKYITGSKELDDMVASILGDGWETDDDDELPTRLFPATDIPLEIESESSDVAQIKQLDPIDNTSHLDELVASILSDYEEQDLIKQNPVQQDPIQIDDELIAPTPLIEAISKTSIAHHLDDTKQFEPELTKDELAKILGEPLESKVEPEYFEKESKDESFDQLIKDILQTDTPEPAIPELDIPEEESLGIESLGIESLGIESLGVESLGVESLGVESLGVESLGVESLGVESLGIESSGIESSGIESTFEFDDFETEILNTDAFESKERPTMSESDILEANAIIDEFEARDAKIIDDKELTLSDDVTNDFGITTNNEDKLDLTPVDAVTSDLTASIHKPTEYKDDLDKSTSSIHSKPEPSFDQSNFQQQSDFKQSPMAKESPDAIDQQNKRSKLPVAIAALLIIFLFWRFWGSDDAAVIDKPSFAVTNDQAESSYTETQQIEVSEQMEFSVQPEVVAEIVAEEEYSDFTSEPIKDNFTVTQEAISSDNDYSARIEQNGKEIVIVIGDAGSYGKSLDVESNDYNEISIEENNAITSDSNLFGENSDDEKFALVGNGALTEKDAVTKKSIAKPKPVIKQTVIVHVIVKGDTLWGIAKRYVNDPYKYAELAKLSKIKNPDRIYPGNVVRIIKYSK